MWRWKTFMKWSSYQIIKVCTEILNQHAPQKKKYFRWNNKPFMNKTLYQAVLQKTKLRNKNLKDKRLAYLSWEKKWWNILPILMERILGVPKKIGKLVKLSFLKNWSQEKNNFSGKGQVISKGIWCRKMFQLVFFKYCKKSWYT